MNIAIPKKIKEDILNAPHHNVCMLYGQHSHECEGRITLEHALIYAGRQINKRWAIIGICAKAHEVDLFQDAHTMRKDLNVWVALNQATEEELEEISKVVDYKRERDRLNRIYGVYQRKLPSISDSGINYPL